MGKKNRIKEKKLRAKDKDLEEWKELGFQSDMTDKFKVKPFQYRAYIEEKEQEEKNKQMIKYLYTVFKDEKWEEEGRRKEKEALEEEDHRHTSYTLGLKGWGLERIGLGLHIVKHN